MKNQTVKQGPAAEYTVLAYCQDKQFARRGRQVKFTCAGVVKGTGLKVETAQEAITLLVEGNWFRFIDESKTSFVLKGHQQSFGYNAKGQFEIKGWEEEVPRDELIRRYLRS